jgi:hypothetical protein
MMKRIIIFTFFCFLVKITLGKPFQPKLYHDLDIAIAHSQKYISNKENHLKKLRLKINKTSCPSGRFRIYFSLYQNYQAYQNDSALSYLSRCIEIAKKMKNRAKEAECIVLTALQCSKTGMYAEALNYLQELHRKELDQNGIKNYYYTMNHLYGEMGSYSRIPSKRQLYFKISNAYQDSIYHVFRPTSETFIIKKGLELTISGQYKKALRYNNKGLSEVKKGTHAYAIVTYYRYLIFKGLGNQEKALYWLTESAICDIKNATMDQASLWTLASNLSKEGDLDRSYQYVTIAWKDANNFGARVRNWQISPILSTISNRYQKKIQQRNNILILLVCTISFMALSLLILVYYVKKQNVKLNVAQLDLKYKNRELEEMNQELETLNQEQRKLLKELSISNKKLNESNSVKEEYIGQFLELCSDYIDKMEKFSHQVNKMVRHHQYEELLHLTNGIEIEDEALDQLFRKFDVAFLHLFPNFIEDLNRLIIKEHHFNKNVEKKFPTPLRILALIRLGIDDSPKIAGFLHHSVTTVYNYRVKYRNWAIGDRDRFERKVKEIDMPIPFKEQDKGNLDA